MQGTLRVIICTIFVIQYTAVCTKNEISLQVAQHFWGFNLVFIFLICNYMCVCVFRAGLLY